MNDYLLKSVLFYFSEYIFFSSKDIVKDSMKGICEILII